jgi:hypothetical protein
MEVSRVCLRFLHCTMGLEDAAYIRLYYGIEDGSGCKTLGSISWASDLGLQVLGVRSSARGILGEPMPRPMACSKNSVGSWAHEYYIQSPSHMSIETASHQSSWIKSERRSKSLPSKPFW